MSGAERFLTLLTRVERGVCIAAFTVMALAVFADVAARAVLGHGLMGALQIGVIGMIAAAFFGAGLASAQGGHLRPRVFDRLIPPALGALADRVAEALTALFCAAFALMALAVTAETARLGDVNPVLGWAVWPAQAVLPLAFASLAARHALYAIRPGLRPGQRDAG